MVQVESQGKFSNAHFKNTFFGMKLMKEFQTEVKHGNRISQARLDVRFQAMVNFLGLTNYRQQRKGGFHDHSVIPGTFLAQFDILRNAFGTTKTPISQHNGLAVVLLKKVQESVIRAVHRLPNPATHLSEGVEYPAQLHPHTPASFILAFLAKLLRGTSLTYRENQFNWKAIHHIQYTWHFHQQIRVLLLRTQLSQQARSMGQSTKQSIVVPLQTPVERPKMPTFELAADTDSPHFAWVQLSAR